MQIHIIKLLLIVLFATLVACQSSDTTQPKASDVNHLEKAIEIDVNQGNLMMIYQDDKGVEQVVTTFNEIPSYAKGNVQIIDLSQSPEQRNSKDVVPIFDLNQDQKHPLYQGKLVSRRYLDKLRFEAKAKVDASKPKYHKVTLYETSWCGYCKKAKAFLKEKNIPFDFFDIEKDQQAAQKLQSTAAAQNFPLGGVPVLEINGKLISGFDPNQIMNLSLIKN